MARYTGPVCRLCRRERMKLYLKGTKCDSMKCPIERRPYPPEMEAARARVFAACRKNKLAFLEGATPDKIAASLDEGVRVISGHNPESAKVGRAHQMRTMPV